MNSNCGIYSITNLTAGKVYIGSSRNLDGTTQSRRYQHFTQLRGGYHPNKHLQSAYNLDGEENFQWEVLLQCPQDTSDKELKYWENYFIDFFDALNPRCGYNFVSADRHSISDETRAKMSAAQLGKKLPLEQRMKISSSLTGRKLTEEHKEKIGSTNSTILKGRPISEESRKKRMGNANHKGHPHTEETKAKISSKLTGRKLSPEHIEKTAAANRGKKRTEQQIANITAGRWK